MKTLYTKILILSLLSFLGTGLSFGQTTILDETLRSGSLPSNWTQSNISFITAGGGFARFDETNSVLTTPTFDTSTNTSIDVKFTVAKWGSGVDDPITIEYSLDVNTFSTGVYLLKVSSKTEQLSTKIIIK